MGDRRGDLEAVGGAVVVVGELLEEGWVADVVLEDVSVLELEYVDGGHFQGRNEGVSIRVYFFVGDTPRKEERWYTGGSERSHYIFSRESLTYIREDTTYMK